MAKPTQHARIIHHPFTSAIQGARLDVYREDHQGQNTNLTLEIQAFKQAAPAQVFEQKGQFFERIQGYFFPMRLQFLGVTELIGSAFFNVLSTLPAVSPWRTISDLLVWRQPEKTKIFYMLAMHTPEALNLQFFARDVKFERSPGQSGPVTIERDWSAPPPLPGRLVPRPKQLYRRFGGDPITVQIKSRKFQRRLFIGGLDVQGEERPDVAAVLNLAEEPSRWVKELARHPADRWIKKGEGQNGMNLTEICEEASWVLERLQDGQCVLVHCAGGVNRSSTICCAVLILLEGLTAEDALRRVREHHPLARPDSRHWLKLRALAARNLNTSKI